jgi:hypothetical protein
MNRPLARRLPNWQALARRTVEGSAVVSDGSKVQQFDRTGMMSVDGRIVDD